MRIVVIGLLLAVTAVRAQDATVPVNSESKDDPCSASISNADMRNCYAKEQVRINLEANSLANEIAANFRKDAQDPFYGPVISGELRKAASAVTKSQGFWAAYRDQHCRAVMYSYTTGSGGGTAYGSCMFNLGKARIQELRSDFNLKQSK